MLKLTTLYLTKIRNTGPISVSWLIAKHTTLTSLTHFTMLKRSCKMCLCGEKMTGVIFMKLLSWKLIQWLNKISTILMQNKSWSALVLPFCLFFVACLFFRKFGPPDKNSWIRAWAPDYIGLCMICNTYIFILVVWERSSNGCGVLEAAKDLTWAFIGIIISTEFDNVAQWTLRSASKQQQDTITIDKCLNGKRNTC